MATKKQQTPPATASTSGPAAVVDPKFELAEKASSYVLRLALPNFKKSDFRVQVDGAGRLTVRGTKPDPGLLHKVFQLPSDASHDDIAGRFQAGVLTLTVPKRASSSAMAPVSVEEIRSKQPGVAKESKPKEEDVANEDALKKEATEDASKKAQQQRKQEEEASKSKQEQHKSAPSPAPQAATSPSQEPVPVKNQEETKAKAPEAAAATPPPEKPAPKPEAVTGSEKAKAAVGPESLAETVRRRGEEEQRANAAAAAAEKEAEAEQEKKAMAACIGGWKERAMGELKGLTNMKWADGLTDMKWADGVVEAARNNKEVVAVSIAAFSLGFFVSQKLFRK